MFTMNWYKGLTAFLMSNTASNVQAQTFTAYNGTSYKPKTTSYFCAPMFGGYKTDGAAARVTTCYKSYTGSSSGGVMFGDGNTAPTLNDYKLSGNLLTTFDYTASAVMSVDANGVTLKTTYTLTNTGSADMTVSEIGLFGATLNSVTYYSILVERTVLDEPITIPPSGVGTVIYTIRFNFPAA